MKKSDIVKVLKAKVSNSYSLYKYYNDKGDKDRANVNMIYTLAYEEVILLLENNKYANDIAKTYNLDLK